MKRSAVLPIGCALVVPVLLTALVRGAAATDDVRCNVPRLCEAWNATFDGPGGGMDFLRAAAESPDGSKVFITGQAFWSGTNQSDLATVAYDAATGVRLWVANYNGPGNADEYGSGITGIRVSPDSDRVFVAGRSMGAGTGEDFVTIAYEAETGAQVWASRFHAGDDRAFGLAMRSDGGVVYTAGNSDGKATMVAYDAATGQELWVGQHPEEATHNVASVAVSPDGARLFLVGERTAPTGQKDGITIAFDAALGQVLWAATYDGPSSLPDFALGVAVSPDSSRTFVTGYSHSTENQFNSSDYVTIAYDAPTGQQLWVARYSGENIAQVAQNVAVSPDGEAVYVTGSSLSVASSWDVVTVAYDAQSGQQLWLTRLLDGPTERTFGMALRVAAGGHRLYVVGSHLPTGSMSSLLTIAYDAGDGRQIWKAVWTPPNVTLGQADAVVLTPDGTRVYAAGSVLRSQQIAYDMGIVAYGPLTVAPSSDLQATPTSGEAPLEVTFSLQGSDPDPTGSIASWNLDVDGDRLADYRADGPPPPSLVHTYDKRGVFTARLTVSDDHGAIGSDEVVITVENRAPIAVDDSATAVNGIRVTINVLANDSDPDGDPLAVTSVSDPPNGTTVINPDQTVTYRPDCGFLGTDTFTYTIDDGNGGTDTGVVTVRVRKTSRRGSIPGC